jgi:hypothetical protein
VRVLSCATNAHVVVSGYHQTDISHRLSLAGSDPVRLAAEHQLTLDVGEHYRVRKGSDGWEVDVVAYFYALARNNEDVIVYHWHPYGRSSIRRPHLHVRADLRIGERWLGKVHLPTGRVMLEDIVRLAIDDLEAHPLRNDWERLINQAVDR